MTNKELAKCFTYMCECSKTSCAECAMPEATDGRRLCAVPELLYRLAANRLMEEK